MHSGVGTVLASGVAWALLGAALVLSHPAPGLAADEPAADEETEEIIVIGSRLLRRDFVGPSPIITLDAEALKLAGVSTIEEALNALPQVIPDADRANPEASGLAAINLRGLGANRTLVMLNGRRFAPSSVGGTVDVNAIPAALIERVEVVTGGASAVYGSDAVVGVVNFVLNDRFEGLQADLQYGVTDQDDGDTVDLSLSAGSGFAGGRGHISGFFNYYDREPILLSEREFTAVPIGDDPETGELFEDGLVTAPEGVILFPSTIIGGEVVRPVIFNPDGSLRPFVFPDDLYNFASDNNNQIPLERLTAAAFVNFDFSSRIRGRFEGLFASNQLRQQQAPSPAGFFGGLSIMSPFLPPATQQVFRDSFDPDGDGIAEVFFVRRMSETGPRLVEHTRDTLRLVAGLEGEFANAWRWEAHYSFTDVDVDPLIGNTISASRFQQALLIDPVMGGCSDPSGGCVPINVYGAGNISPEAADFVRFGEIENDEKIEEQILSAAVTGRLGDLPGGSVNGALGLEWRRLEASFAPDPALLANDVLGFQNFQPAIGASEVVEVFGEVLVPLLEDRPWAHYLGVEAGLRGSDYNTAGRVSTWKFGVDWAPVDSLRVRLMLQKAVRAPNIIETFELPEQGFLRAFGPTNDLCSASNDPVGNGLTDICVSQGLDPALLGVYEAEEGAFTSILRGGNLALEPEDSDSVTLGLVLQPRNHPGFSASLDYFDIQIADAIRDIGFDSLAVCFASRDPDNEFCDGFVRDDSGALVEAISIPRNVTKERSEGIDLQVRYEFETPSLALIGNQADIGLSLYATQYLTNGGQASPITPFLDCAGHFGRACSLSSFGTLPEYKVSTRLSYGTGPLRTSLRWRWISGMKNSLSLESRVFDLPTPVLAIPEVGSRSYFDLSATYEISDSFEIYGGITNLFDRGPPLLAGQSTGINTDPATYDVIGRRFFLGVSFRI